MYYLSVEMRNLPLNTYVTCSGLHKLSMAEVGFELCVFDIEVLFYSWHKFQHWEGQLAQTLSHSALLYPDTSDNGADYLSGQFMTFFFNDATHSNSDIQGRPKSSYHNLPFIHSITPQPHPAHVAHWLPAGPTMVGCTISSQDSTDI